MIDEVVVHVTDNAPWLPSGGRAEVIRASVAPRPMSLARLLVRREDQVLCVPRDGTGAVDLPTRVVPQDDADGSITAAGLARQVFGRDIQLTFVGAVRNVVVTASADYAWPTPWAHFGVWASAATDPAEGVWTPLSHPALRDRHWYPLTR